ncbi:MAG: hypothetical protein EOO62_15875, partial [Hymenobacter sp.]
DNVFAIGDIAQMATTTHPEGHPQVAQPAIQQGCLLGENIQRLLGKQPLQPFVYEDKGTMATIGRHRAVGDIQLFGKQYHITGWLGWLGWSLVHVLALVSFRNRIAVFIAWAWNYVTQDKGMSAEASAHALKYLEELNVQVWLDNKVTSYDGYTVCLKSGENLVARTLIWAAGVTGAPVPGLAPAALLKSNRYQVNEFNQVAGYDNVFAIGDIAQMATATHPEGHPQVAQPAIQQGRLLGENIIRAVGGLPMLPFDYYDKGTMATVGRNRALADIQVFGKQYHLSGWIGWLAWSLVHVLALVSFRNRFAVFITWAWNYVTQDKGMRYIIGRVKAPMKEKEVDAKAIV